MKHTFSIYNKKFEFTSLNDLINQKDFIKLYNYFLVRNHYFVLCVNNRKRICKDFYKIYSLNINADNNSLALSTNEAYAFNGFSKNFYGYIYGTMRFFTIDVEYYNYYLQKCDFTLIDNNHLSKALFSFLRFKTNFHKTIGYV